MRRSHPKQIIAKLILGLAMAFGACASTAAQIAPGAVGPSGVRAQNISYTERDRFEVYRDGGHSYITDGRGADLLKLAIVEGYRQGFAAGAADNTASRRSKCSHSDIYKDALHGYDTHVDRGQYRHYFRQGFEYGYLDGFTGHSEYGYTDAGQRQVLIAVVNDLMTVVAR